MLGSCRLLRHIAHVSVTTFHDQTATACHFFTLRNGVSLSNAGPDAAAAAAAVVTALPSGAHAAALVDDRVVRCRLLDTPWTPPSLSIREGVYLQGRNPG
jgi:hypothetical protein